MGKTTLESARSILALESAAPSPETAEVISKMLQEQLEDLQKAQNGLQANLLAAQAAGPAGAAASAGMTLLSARLRTQLADVTMTLNNTRINKMAKTPGLQAPTASAAVAVRQPPALSAVPQLPATPVSSDRFCVPRVAVFDLDETCWNHFGLDHKPPFRPPFGWSAVTGQVLDSVGSPVRIFPELRSVLLSLHQAGVKIAVASHDTKPAWCRQVMDSYVLDEAVGLTWGHLVEEDLQVIRCTGVYWPGKKQHLADIRERAPGGPCEFKDMLVFDDSKKICSEAANLGAVAVRCHQGGITMAKLQQGLQSWRPGGSGWKSKKRPWPGSCGTVL